MSGSVRGLIVTLGLLPQNKRCAMSPTRQDLRVKIGEASHNHSNPSLGNGVPRMASPVYVSIVKISDKYAPVVTELNCAFPPGYQRADIRKQMDFVKEVLK